MRKYKKGDLVKVWSLQSFSGGGFLKGERAVVRQNQSGDSVIVCVVRKIDGEYKVDTAYEVYDKQVELDVVEDKKQSDYIVSSEKLMKIRNTLLDNKNISDEYGLDKYL